MTSLRKIIKMKLMKIVVTVEMKINLPIYQEKKKLITQNLY